MNLALAQIGHEGNGGLDSGRLDIIHVLSELQQPNH